MDKNEQESDTITEEKAGDIKNNDKSSQSTFKKPLLVGKIGKLPKELKHSRSTEKITQESLPDTSEGTDASQKEIISKPENDTQKTETPSLPYKEPIWSGLPKSTSKSYYFEVLKDGSIIDKVDLMDKPFWVFGRLANCDISMQHPTISRYHAILQYRSEPDEMNEAGFYIYDLGSTHGTFLNKNKLRSRVYVRIQVGHILKLGCSTRNYLLNGPEEDAEVESELSVTELKQKRQEEIKKRELERIEELQRMEKEEEERKKKEEERGIDWGLGEDADEDTDISENPFAQSNNEELYLDDPKKTLRGYFEREGLNLEYDCSEQGMGQFLCKVELPIDDERGRPIYAEVLHKGKKKEAVVQCALEACRILDRYGMLRQAVHESRKRKAKDWAENDYYDSDDDTFLDRTGEIEKKREKRMNLRNPKKAETYESLMEKEKEMANSIKTLEKQLIEAQEKAKNSKSTPSEEDSLDDFMKNLKDSKPDKTTISKLRNELAKSKLDHAKVIKLVNLVKPASLPPLVAQYDSEITSQSGKSKVLPLFGKRKKVPVVVPQKTSMVSEKMEVDDEEEEEEEESDVNKRNADDVEGIEPQNKESVVEEIEPQNEESLVADEPQNEESMDADEPQKNPAYGLQTRKETTDRHVESESTSVEDTCEGMLKSVFDNVKTISKKISSLENPEQRSLVSHNLVSTIFSGVNRINWNLTELIVEECEENLIENSKKEGSPKHVDSPTEDASKKKKNQRRIQQRQEKAEIEKRKGYAEDARKTDYSMWVPPKDQTGDGRTKLNEKFGY